MEKKNKEKKETKNKENKEKRVEENNWKCPKCFTLNKDKNNKCNNCSESKPFKKLKTFNETQNTQEKMITLPFTKNKTSFVKKTILYTFLRNSFSKDTMNDVLASLDRQLLRY
jgi:hypothetical protein